MPDRVRYSIREIQYEYDHGDRKPLENLVRAFHGIQKKKRDYKLPLEDDLSFFHIAGFHGEPFEGPGKNDPKWW